MYIVAIAWIYVTLLMALTETSFVAGAAAFFFYGLFPLAIPLWLLGTPERRRRQRRAAAAAEASATAKASTGYQASGRDPDQRSHPSAVGAPTVGPESPAVGEGAKAAAVDPGDARRR